MSDELKRCERCASSPIVLIDREGRDEDEWVWAVYCASCYAITEEDYFTRADAIAAWNRRSGQEGRTDG